MMLNDVLNAIDAEQYIKIQFHGDTIYMGKRKYFIPTDEHACIGIINILTDLVNGICPYITICIDKGFD